MVSTSSSDSTAPFLFICSTSIAPPEPGFVKSIPLMDRSRVTRLAFFDSASTRGVISESSSSYGHVKVRIVPFLSASSGRPAPTCQSCTAFATTVKPACRAANTSSIQVFRIATTEIVMDLGSRATNSKRASSEGVAVPACTCLITATYTKPCSTHCGKLSMSTSAMMRVAL